GVLQPLRRARAARGHGARGRPRRVVARGGLMDAIREYNDRVAADPLAAAEQAAWMADQFRRHGLTFDGEPMRSFLRPHFVTRADWDALRDGGRRLIALGARGARRAVAAASD